MASSFNLRLLTEPLLTAARRGDLMAVRALLDAGADVEGSDVNGWRPLHYAALYGFRELVALLLSRGEPP
jgi:ankyrin repeat protein